MMNVILNQHKNINKRYILIFNSESSFSQGFCSEFNARNVALYGQFYIVLYLDNLYTVN